jgi:CheY-like chemotaxis protein
MEQREEQFRQAHKMEALGRMAGGVAHDFNNMLAVVFASVDLLKRAIAAEKTEMVSRHIGVVQQAATQAARLTRQLLDFSRRREVASELTEPLDVIESMAELLQQVAGRRVRVEIDALGEIEPARIERAQLEQVVLNLVGNAGDAMPNGGALQIRLRSVDRDESRAYGDDVPDGRWTLLSVRDSGHGIPAEIRDRVFEPFFTTKDVGHGTGLGLATVYGAVSSAGGHIRLTSERGQGTEMRVYLPTVSLRATVSGREPDGVAISPRAARRGRGERVIVCDDSAAIRSWITQVLSEDGYDATAAASGDECLSLCERGAVDLLVTDVRMPEMDGPTLRRRMRELVPELPTVFMSGFAADLLEREGVDPRSEAFLDKPFSREQLIEAVTTVLAQSRGQPRVAREG